MERRTEQTRRSYRRRGKSSPACVVCGMRAACGGPGGLPLGSATHFHPLPLPQVTSGSVQQCRHAAADRQTHRHRPQYISHRLRLMQNIKIYMVSLFHRATIMRATVPGVSAAADGVDSRLLMTTADSHRSSSTARFNGVARVAAAGRRGPVIRLRDDSYTSDGGPDRRWPCTVLQAVIGQQLCRRNQSQRACGS